MPSFLGTRIRPIVGEFLDTHGVGVRDLSFLAIHPGGPRILDEVERAFEVGPALMEPSRAVRRLPPEAPA